MKTANARWSFVLALLISVVTAAPAAAAGTLTVKKSPQDDAATIFATKPVRNADGVPTGAREPVLECGGVCEAAVADAFGRPDAVTLVSKAAAGWELCAGWDHAGPCGPGGLRRGYEDRPPGHRVLPGLHDWHLECAMACLSSDRGKTGPEASCRCASASLTLAHRATALPGEVDHPQRFPKRPGPVRGGG